MKKRIREYIDELFKYAPKTKKALELKEEIIANAEEKFADLLAEGYQEEDAFEVIIHSIGNIQELFDELRQEEEEENYSYRMLELELQQKKARYTAIAVGLYVFAGALFFMFAALEEGIGKWVPVDMSILGLTLAAFFCIAPTVMIVYASNLLPPSHKKKEEDIMQGWGTKQTNEQNKERNKEVRKAIRKIIWTLTLILYFWISFHTMAWYITWVIFLIAGCIESVIQLIFSIRK